MAAAGARDAAGWIDVLEEVAREAEERFGSLGPFTAADVAALVGLAFLGGEAMILLGDEAWADRVRAALRRVGDLIRALEESRPSAAGSAGKGGGPDQP